MKYIYFILVILFNTLNLSSQVSKGFLLVITGDGGNLYVDGDFVEIIKESTPTKVQIEVGEHYIEIKNANKSKSEIVLIEEGKQKVIKFEMKNSSETFRNDNKYFENNINATAVDLNNESKRVNVINRSINIPGISFTSAGQELYFSFDSGDKIIIDINMTNEKGTNSIKIIDNLSNTILFSKSGFQNLNNQEIDIVNRGIYKIILSSSHMFDRNCEIKIDRIPRNGGNFNYNCIPLKKRYLKPFKVLDSEISYINSTSNESLKGGITRLIKPVELPQNTVEFYYTFAAFRNKEDLQKVANKFNLFSQLSSLVEQNGQQFAAVGTASKIAIELLNSPPGSDYCDVYLLPSDQDWLFLSKGQFKFYVEYSRLNQVSGVVKCIPIKNVNKYWLGFINNDLMHGINIRVDVVALVEDFQWEDQN